MCWYPYQPTSFSGGRTPIEGAKYASSATTPSYPLFCGRCRWPHWLSRYRISSMKCLKNWCMEAARDKNECLTLYVDDTPQKDVKFWYAMGNQTILPKAMLPNVRWEDDEPTKVVILELKTYQRILALAASVDKSILKDGGLPDVY